jgi:hypothetical protein
MDKLTFAPVELTLYDANDEPVKTFSKSVIRWGMLKQAIKLAKQLEGSEKELTEDSLDALSAFACRLFDDQFTQEALEAGADIAEVMACFKAVVNRAKSMGNA